MLESLAAALADRYTIEREIGAGGMGTVYLARELKHDRQVALKVLRPEIASHLGVVRFLNEVKVTAKLDHPHILTLIDSGEADEFLWYVQPFVRGESLRAKLDREKQLSIEEAVAITRQVASALEHAHQRGVIHRDIKPANILIHEGEAMVADFGIALAVTEAEIGDHRFTFVNQNIRRLDVAMNHAALVRVLERAGDLPGDGHRFFDAELLLAIELGPERFAPHEGLDVPQELIGLAGVDQREDVRMIEPRGDLHFIEKSDDAEVRGDFWAQNLERDLAVVLQLAREVHCPHAAGPDFAFDRVPIGKCCGQGFLHSLASLRGWAPAAPYYIRTIPR